MTEVRCPLEGSVALLYVDDGDRVEAGQELLAMECMKTFWPVRAPAPGRVRLRCRPGAVVGRDDVLAVIEP